MSPFFADTLIFYLGKVPNPFVFSIVQRLLLMAGWGLDHKPIRPKMKIAELIGLTP